MTHTYKHTTIHFPLKPPKDNEWLRPVSEDGNTYLCHFWYFPDSYDTRLKKQDVESQLEPAVHRGNAVVTMDRVSSFFAPFHFPLTFRPLCPKCLVVNSYR